MTKKISLSTIIVGVLAIAGLLFLYLPVVVVVLYSFNDAAISSFPMSGFTLNWYKVMLENNDMISALGNSLIVAVIGTIIAILISIPGAYGLYKFKFPGKAIFEKLVVLPMMLPGMITGIAILSFLQMIGVMQGPLAVILGHATFLIGTVLPQVYTRLRQLDKHIEEAALDLGATQLQTFVKVILPNVKTAVFGAALLSITLSIDEIPVTYFLNGVFTTLPIKVYAMTRNGFTPEVNAMCSVILIFSVVAVILSNIISQKGE